MQRSFITYISHTFCTQDNTQKPQECSHHSNYAMGWTVWSLNTGRGNIFFHSPKQWDWLWRTSSLLFNGYQCSCPGI